MARTTARLVMGAALFACAVSASTLGAQATDPIMGTWVLNVAKSKYEVSPPPKSQTRTYTAAPSGFKFVADAADGAGKKSHVEFTVAFDGKYHVMTGSPTADSIMVKRTDAATVESTQKKGAKEVSHTIRTVAKDGKTVTFTTHTTDDKGKKITNVEVYDKK